MTERYRKSIFNKLMPFMKLIEVVYTNKRFVLFIENGLQGFIHEISCRNLYTRLDHLKFIEINLDQGKSSWRNG